MADADEDHIPRTDPATSSTSIDPSADLEDEAQDYGFLAQLTGSKSAGSASIPRRGEKDFEPNPTQAQSNTLALSREAMHNALSVERVLAPRNPIVGQYLPDPRDWRWDTRPDAELGTSGWGGRCVVVEKFATTYAKSLGVTDYRNWTWLLPEEALFLLERGTLDVRWPDEKVKTFMKGHAQQDPLEVESGTEPGKTHDNTGDQSGQGDDSDEGIRTEQAEDLRTGAETSPEKKPHPHHWSLEVGEVPMSLQGAYASFIGKSGLTVERYNVYAGLRRLGYIVLRASTWDEHDQDQAHRVDDEQRPHARPDGHISQPTLPPQPAASPTPPPATRSHPQLLWSPSISLISRLVTYLFPPKPIHYRPVQGPLIYPGLYGDYKSIFRSLALIPYHGSAVSTGSTAPPSPPAPSTSTSILSQPSSSLVSPHPSPSVPNPPFTIAWHVHKPSPNTQFRKTAPPPPDFRVVVIDARTTAVPTAAELGALLDSTPLDELPRDKRMEMRMRHGMRNVVLGVVDCGLVSYLRFADLCSGVNGRLFEVVRSAGRGGKRGGGGAWKRGGRGGKR